MVMPLEANYIHGLRGWAEGIIADKVVTSPQSMAKVVLELLDHIQFLKDAVATEDYIRTTGGHTLPHLEDGQVLLKRVRTCPICLRPKTHHRLHGYRCDTPGHDEMARDLSHT